MSSKNRIFGEYYEKDDSFLISVSKPGTIIPAYTGYNKEAWYEDKSLKHINTNFKSQSISSLLIDSDVSSLNMLEKRLNLLCPNVYVKEKFNNVENAISCISSNPPDLVFFGIDDEYENQLNILLKNNSIDFETVFVTEKDYLNIATFQYNISGCLSKPIEEIQLINIVDRVNKKINIKKENKKLLKKFTRNFSQKDIVGIPTLDGFEFLKVHEIIFCEGMQKSTKLFTSSNSEIISSYNIGEFIKLLCPFGFFSPHKSFLVNLLKIEKYNKEGTLLMNNNYHIPLARRKKEDFLKSIKKGGKFPIIHQG